MVEYVQRFYTLLTKNAMKLKVVFSFFVQGFQINSCVKGGFVVLGSASPSAGVELVIGFITVHNHCCL